MLLQLFVKIILWLIIIASILSTFQAAFEDFAAWVIVQISLCLLHQEI
jgi:hypothetical protein